jgi:hypothetical protein
VKSKVVMHRYLSACTIPTVHGMRVTVTRRMERATAPASAELKRSRVYGKTLGSIWHTEGSGTISAGFRPLVSGCCVGGTFRLDGRRVPIAIHQFAPGLSTQPMIDNADAETAEQHAIYRHAVDQRIEKVDQQQGTPFLGWVPRRARRHRHLARSARLVAPSASRQAWRRRQSSPWTGFPGSFLQRQEPDAAYEWLSAGTIQPL